MIHDPAKPTFSTNKQPPNNKQTKPYLKMFTLRQNSMFLLPQVLVKVKLNCSDLISKVFSTKSSNWKSAKEEINV